MHMFSPQRLALYGSAIAVLVCVWLAAAYGLLPFGARREVGVFKVPDDSVDEQGATGARSLNQRERANAKRRGSRDEFADSLNRLSSDDSAEGDDAAAASKSSTPTPSPLDADQDAQQRRDAASRIDGDDARHIFSGLETPEGSRVEDILPGVVARGPVGAAPVPDATPVVGRPWATGQARGYTMLYAMQPEARPVVEAHVQALLGSRVRQLYIGVLIDGFFGRDFAYLRDVISRLSDEDRSLTLALYMTNGATMRKWRTTPVDELFTRINPEEFRREIRWNQRLRAEFLAVAIQARELFRFNQAQGTGNSNVAIVMLEDNLDVAAYRSMREIAAEQVGSIAGFVRNPCLGCFKGNDDDTAGDPREEHELKRFNVLKRGDGYSLDGVGFQYPNSPGDGIPPEQLRELMQRSTERGLRYVGLWRHDWQGVIEGVPNKIPATRTYIASNPDQQAFEIEMLRTGLVFEEQDDETLAQEGAR